MEVTYREVALEALEQLGRETIYRRAMECAKQEHTERLEEIATMEKELERVKTRAKRLNNVARCLEALLEPAQ